MKEFISDCLDHYAMAMVIVFWIPLMLIALPIALVAVILKTAYQVISEMFGVQDE
jgi:hypothetical protein